ncbi:hypothetical protein K08M3_14190 [Vibrio alginolyticus]|uniref:Uncharacterized protein n=1 Tax=Vibrio alginolyticus TaxID=663 RepID=A0A1W6TBL5_VIBAL|nr:MULTISPECIES: hypothetical protein [Vibrio]ARO98360.1 hypothetical protein K01M1_14170 [Vibrio alginolyticus]ARP03076.1 hypothetical protein K04M1_14280 [Vibrio alginolyticus]ARP08134.1 hypothetical protein K04M3_14310 [Vibrio alginolyticus]ARP13196.1 hypothetical protein K04M5_13960 [Vibrio alginolyticus]ARP18256.1 hypothetical protein K05K4_14200 [Vibrio alginolyticus]
MSFLNLVRTNSSKEEDEQGWTGNSLDLLRMVGSLDEYRREQLKDQEYQEEAEKRINAIREKMKQHEQSRLVSQEEALLEQSERERKRRELLEQLGGIDE